VQPGTEGRDHCIQDRFVPITHFDEHRPAMRSDDLNITDRCRPNLECLRHAWLWPGYLLA
jgi:hypothetical protein